MKKRTRNVLILLAALLILFGTYFLLTAVTRQDEEKPANEAKTLFSCDQEDIENITYKFEGEEVTLLKKDSGWVYEKDEQFPLDLSYVESMLSALSNVEVNRSFEAKDDLASYGLSSPTAQITASLKDGSTVSFNVGAYNNVTSSYYLAKDGDDNIYMSSSGITSAFSLALMELAEGGSLPESYSNAKVYEINYASKERSIKLSSPVTMDTYYDGYEWQADEGKSSWEANAETVNEIISEVQSLDLTKLKAYNVDEKTLLKLGFSDAAELELKYSYEVEGAEDEEGASKDDNKKDPVYEKAALKLYFAKADDEKYYVMMDKDDKVYEIDALGIEAIIGLNSDSLAVSDVVMLDLDTVEAMDVTYNNKTYKVELSRKTVEGEGGVEETKLSALIDKKAVGGAYIEGFFEDILSIAKEGSAKKDVAGENVLTIVFYRDTDDEFKQMTLNFKTYDSSFMRASFALKENMLVNKRDVENLMSTFDEILKLLK